MTRGQPTQLGPGREFDRIRRILTGVKSGEDVRIGPGDDGCILDDGLVISTDLTVEGVHFQSNWISDRQIGYRAAVAGLSDLAAMAAAPVGLLASVAAPADGSRAESLMEGVKDAADTLDIPLLGGDLTRSPGPLIVDVVSIGRTEMPLLRSEARVGDDLWVTGALGGAAAAVALWEAESQVPPELVEAYARPLPRVREALWLASEGVRAGLDVSDGLAGDAGHLAAASGVAVELHEASIPVHPGLAGNPARPGSGGIELALRGGEDYELLISAPAGLLDGRADAFRRKFGVDLTRVGRVREGSGVFLCAKTGDPPRPIDVAGYDHFSEDGRQ